ncbi:DUF4118 domain-containing protein [Dyella solisilvae]|nr:DUF4118 domain-containing protein [Dyella solisilvae]
MASTHGLLPALLACAVATLAAGVLLRVFDLSNVVILFLFTVVLVALRWGKLAGAVAALFGVVSFDFFFVPPVYSFHLSDTQYLFTFALTLVVALVIGQLAARLREETASAIAGEHRATALANVAGLLSAAVSTEEIVDECNNTIAPMFGSRGWLLLPDAQGRINTQEPMLDGAVAQWVYARGREAGCDRSGEGSPVRYTPVVSPLGTRGVLALQGVAPSPSAAGEQQRLFEACCALIGQALERIHFADLAREAEVRIEGERLRHALLAAVSHDLKTPLTAIRGMAETLESATGLPQAERVSAVRAIRDQSDALHRLVVNLLDLARMQEHGIHLNREWHAIGEVVEVALAGAAMALGARQIHIHLDADLPLVELDACLFERVLANLLDNAAKYTQARANLWIGAHVGGNGLLLQVEDDGPGLPSDVLPETLFAPFARGVRESAISGVGLGLTLCRSIVEAHGGALHAYPRQPVGARFEIRLPLRQPPSIEPEQNL